MNKQIESLKQKFNKEFNQFVEDSDPSYCLHILREYIDERLHLMEEELEFRLDEINRRFDNYSLKPPFMF